MGELWNEILGSIARNKLRSVLTGFSVAWGIFMLVILLGSGNGLRNGAMSQFGERLVNVIQIWSGWTSQPYGGYSSERRIWLDKGDSKYISETFRQTEGVSGRMSRSGNLSYGNDVITANLQGVSHLQEKISGSKVVQGRFFSIEDMEKRNKVAVLDLPAAEILFPREDPLGKYLIFDKIAYRIIGVVEPRWRGGSYYCYVPITTIETIYSEEKSRYGGINFLVEGLDTKEQNEAFNTRLREGLAARHTFARDDQRAVWISNRYEQYVQQNGVMTSITMFIWLVGIGTLLAGVVGVSNIMLVTVRERMNEIGIRKSLGATPWSIINMVLFESLIITVVAGYIGLVAGMLTMEGVNAALQNMVSPDSNLKYVFKDPTINLGIALSATGVLVIAGLVAGYIPARKAVKMKTIDALRYGK